MKISKAIGALLIALLQVGTSEQKQQVCHALALSGGANKGAYEAGVLHGLAHKLDNTEIAWDVVTGVSAGSVNTAGIGMFPVGKEKEMTEFLIDTLEGLHTEDIYKFWPGGILEGITDHSGILNDDPLL